MYNACDYFIKSILYVQNNHIKFIDLIGTTNT